MAWLRHSRGRARQLQQMGTELDPTIVTYGEEVCSFGDDLDQLIGLCSWRLPRSRFAAASTLWNLWEVEGAITQGRSGSDILEGMGERVMQVLVARKAQARRLWRDLTKRHPQFQNDPAWFESDGWMIRLADTWFYLRHKHLTLMAVLVITMGEVHLSSLARTKIPIELPTAFMLRRKGNGVIMELKVSMTQAEGWKIAGDQHYKRGQLIQAGWAFLNALARLAPWCPLEMYMPCWEGKVSGLNALYFALIFNLGLVALKLDLAQWSLAATDAIIDHPFITNRLSAKLHHLQARALEKLAIKFPAHLLHSDQSDDADHPADDDSFSNRTDYALQAKRHYATRDVYLRLAPEKVSFLSECVDFDVRSAMDSAFKLDDYGNCQNLVEREFEDDGILGRAETIMRQRTETIWFLGEEL